MPTINYTIDEYAVASITLNRDEKCNAFNDEMARAFLQGLERAEQEDARVVVMRANPGVKVWCAGHDLSELDPGTLDAQNPKLKIFEKIQSTPLPVIAMVEGKVFAAGLIILLYSDIVIASKNAEVAITSNKLGIPFEPELYAYWLRVMGIHHAKELLFTANAISAEDAYCAGLYNHVVDTVDLEQITAELAHRIIECSPAAVANAKYQLNLLAGQTALEDGARAEIETRNAEIRNSRDTRDRISTMLASLRRPRKL